MFVFNEKFIKAWVLKNKRYTHQYKAPLFTSVRDPSTPEETPKPLLGSQTAPRLAIPNEKMNKASSNIKREGGQTFTNLTSPPFRLWYKIAW
jgi:hypothetical protein